MKVQDPLSSPSLYLISISVILRTVLLCNGTAGQSRRNNERSKSSLAIINLLCKNSVCNHNEKMGTTNMETSPGNSKTCQKTDLCTIKIENQQVVQSYNREELYCIYGYTRKEIHRLFSTVWITIETNGSYFDLDRSNRLETLKPKRNVLWQSLQSFVSRPITQMNATTEHVSPFEDVFLKVYMRDEHSQHWLYVKEIWFDKSLFLSFLTGIFLFCFAKALCRHMSFIYFSGFSLGLFISWLFLLLLLVKFLPAKKGLITSVLFVGTNLGLYIAKTLSDNFIALILYYRTFLMWYSGIVGFATFAAIYYYDPARNVRFLNLVQWTLQLSGCYLVFIGTRIEEVSITIIVFMVTTYVLMQFISPLKLYRELILFCLPHSLRYKLFKPKMRILTEAEYVAEGVKKKKEELDSLREYCSSPECDTWKIVSRLKDPKRFALFMETGMDISMEEMSGHDKWEDSASRDWFTSDEDDTLDGSLIKCEDTSHSNGTIQ